MMRDKGQQLRERYAPLLEGAQPARDVHVQSTNIRRTIRSAQSLLAGVFPEHFVYVDADNQVGANEALLPDSRKFLSHIQTHRRLKKEDPLIIHADDSNSLAPQHSYELYRDLGKMLADELSQHAPPGFAQASQQISAIIGAGSSKLVAWTGCKCAADCNQQCHVTRRFYLLVRLLTGLSLAMQCERCSSAARRTGCPSPKDSTSSFLSRSASTTRGCGTTCTARWTSAA
ncbi:unnamed protein product [Phytophthora fragariaefolia]|uniref:Unnamed protein product n=1 Tax=Phytophthora fragariaefolia TaxID=1490495 RepID=A0A9W6XDQ6_9STRA|nr:unnamed protein product [Phytophthora fragariaefolia]